MNSIFRLIIRKFHISIAIVGLTIGFLVLIPQAAQAATSVALDTTNDFVKVATVYKTKPNTQTEVLSKVLEFEESTLTQTPGLINSSILKGQEGTEVVVLTQWQDLPSFEAYAQEYSNNELYTDRPQIFVFEVQKVETRGLKPAIAESGEIMFSQFKLKDPQKQSELAGIIEQVMPTAFVTVPGLQWAAMSPSTDRSTIAMIAQWNSRKDFESLGQNAGFDKETNYWDPYADNEHDIFDVVKIIK
ncbi:MAG: antibiotic biosynthesis monooxygenase [Xenococcaceae cyanobacterium MO_188.B29]|nr:antibiotic biosynthesis monooxygenase [Xenococcaceae cyanobacterium MO_188.B29]